MTDNRRLLVQALKGSRAQVVLCFFFSQMALKTDEIREWTGLKLETIRDACKSLESIGLLGHQNMEHGEKLWLPAGAMLPLVHQELSDGQNTEKRIPEITATTTDSLDLNINNTVVVGEQNTGKRIPDVQYLEWGVTFDANLAACRAAGIGEPKASELSALPHVSPTLIKAHKDSLKKGETLGLAILRIINDEFPRVWEKQIAAMAPREEDGSDE